MKDETIPDQNHIARFCRPMQVNEGVIQATAFMLKVDEANLSVNCLELLNSTSREGEITEVRTIYSKKLNVGKSAKIAILNSWRSAQKSADGKSRPSKS